MNIARRGIADIFGLAIAMFLGCAIALGAASDGRRSPDGKYAATLTRSDSGTHFQVKEVKGGRVVLTTRAQYPSPNDVKAGKFSADSTKFAAAYHYGHEGQYTWIGVWNLKDGEFIRSAREEGWTSQIPSSVFNKPKEDE